MKNRQVFSLVSSVALCLAALVILLVLVGSSAGAQATARYVAAVGIDSGDCTDSANPCQTVQYAVDAASEGDVIKVATGVYSDINNHGGVAQVVYISKTITIRGGYTTAFAEPPDSEANATTLNAQGHGRAVYVAGLNSPVLDGLRLTGGMAEHGGGLYVSGAQATIMDCVIFSNTASSTNNWEGGGGVYFYSSNSKLLHNTIISNTAYRGGGVYIFGSDKALVDGNNIADNKAHFWGGGLYLRVSEAALKDNTIQNNVADYDGGGIGLQYSAATLISNTIQGNATEGDGGGLGLWEGASILIGNIVADNTAGDEGGGLEMYYSTGATLARNYIVGNKAQLNGGGLRILQDWGSTLTNNVIAANVITDGLGSGLYVHGGNSRFYHTTVADNSGGEGTGVDVDNAGFGFSTVWFTNTILVSQTVGISVTAGNTATLEATLWGTETWPNGTEWGGDGTIITGTHNFWGNPAFVNTGKGDYHIGPASAAIDRGVDAGVTRDMDNEPRLGPPDLGADEYWAPGALKKVYLPLVLRNAP